MPIEMIFVAVLGGIAKDALKGGVHEALRAMSEQEILETDLNRLVSQPFRSANAHLQNAAIESVDVRRQQHIEYARLDFIKASDLDAPLPAARAAFYAGLCHRLRGENRHELMWYERAISMLSEIEDRLEKRREKFKAVGKGAVLTSLPMLLILPVIPVAAGVYLGAVDANVKNQLHTIHEHKKAIQVVIETLKDNSLVRQDQSG